MRCSTVEYAIILASSKEDHPEKLIVAYTDEYCLRDLIARRSIVGFGFQSREEAMAELVGSVPDPKAAKGKHSPFRRRRRLNRTLTWRAGGFVRNYRNTFHTLRGTLATFSVLFYSKNLLSIILRAALGFPS